PKSWNGISVDDPQNIPPDGMDLSFYERIEYESSKLPEQAAQIFRSLQFRHKNPERTIFIVTLRDLTISWYEKEKNGRWKKVTSGTSAISIPTYSYGEGLPKDVRGTITFQRSKPHRKTMAHELGHKLINVSHEGGDHGPQGDGDNIPGLMGYGDSLEILAGSKGRFHLERLMKSPFLYKMIDGKKIYNPDFKKNGIYTDPIYGNAYMKPIKASEAPIPFSERQ
ncbi:MAG: hypothetical protein AAF203_07500, partial [Pseudomonadota bacterium]